MGGFGARERGVRVDELVLDGGHWWVTRRGMTMSELWG